MSNQGIGRPGEARLTLALLGRWETALLALLLGVIVMNSFLSPYFLDFLNLVDSTLTFSEKALIALPMALLMISREIDVSVASIVAMAAVFMGIAGEVGAATPVVVSVGLLTGLAAGLFNGVIVSVLGIHSIVVTIGTLSLYRGIAVAIVGDEAYTTFPTDFFFFGRSYLGDVFPFEFALYLGMTIVFAVVLHYTIFGRRIFAIGNNPEAARYSGIRVTLYRVTLFGLTGLMAGLASVLLTSRLGSVRLNIATGWELQVITMVVLGVVSIMGGVGTIVGVTLAIFLIWMLTFGLSLINVPGIVINLFIGVLLISAIAIPTLIQRFSTRR